MAREPKASAAGSAIEEIVVPAGKTSPDTIQVKAGETWRFVAHGLWRDWYVPCGPEGYRFFPLYILDVRPSLEDAPFFCVIARFKGEPETAFQVGAGLVHTFDRDGELEFLANNHDAWTGNKAGKVKVLCKRDRAAEGFGWLAEAWRLTLQTVDRTTGVLFVAALVLATGAALAFLPQGRDLVRAIGEDGPRRGDFGPGWRQIAFGVTLFFLSMQAWFWPRVIINFNYGSHREAWRPRWLLEWAPRLLGFAPGVFATIALLRNPAANVGFAVVVALASIAFFALVIWRNDIANQVRRRRLKRARAAGEPDPPRSRAPARVGRFWVCLGLSLALITLIMFCIWPVGPARFLGAPAVVFLGVGLIIPPVVIAIQTGAPFRFPVVGLLVLLAVVFGFTLDNHKVGRRVGAPEIVGSIDREKLEAAYARWRAQAPRDGGVLPMVIVASEGGASRAGFWTGQVLAALHERTGGQFSQSLFAISSVSGGSVGAVGYVAALREGQPHDQMETRLAAFTGDDALSPTMAGLLYPDLIQRFLPAPIPFFPDRAEALERAWETSWARCPEGLTCGGDLMSGAFLDLWRDAGDRWIPLVIINGASEERGRRILTTPVRFAPHQIDAEDFHDTVGADVRASTAIHNGARFPYISPAGSLWKGEERRGHIVDGGYFEATGLEAARELARAISAGPAAQHGDSVRFIFIFIGYNQSTADVDAAARRMPTQLLANEALAPLVGLSSARSALGRHVVGLLHDDITGRPSARLVTSPVSTPAGAATAIRGAYIPVLLTDNPRCDRPPRDVLIDKFEMPMDWALSRYAQDQMRYAAGFDGYKPDCPPNPRIDDALRALPTSAPR